MRSGDSGSGFCHLRAAYWPSLYAESVRGLTAWYKHPAVKTVFAQVAPAIAQQRSVSRYAMLSMLEHANAYVCPPPHFVPVLPPARPTQSVAASPAAQVRSDAVKPMPHCRVDGAALYVMKPADARTGWLLARIERQGKSDILESKLHRYVSMEIYDERPFTVHRRHKGHGLEVGEVYGASNGPVSLKETSAYLPLRLAPTGGAGLALVVRVDKFKGREEFVVYDGETTEVFTVKQLSENRVEHLQAQARQATAPVPAPPKRSHKRRASA